MSSRRASASAPGAAEREAVVKVGYGRGFVVEGGRRGRLVVTAAHCLPQLPPPHPGSYLGERTFPNLLRRIGERRRTIWAECLFVDPVADLAVLCGPDNQELADEADAYDEFTEAVPCPLRIGDIPKSALTAKDTTTYPGWLLTLKRRWAPCRVYHAGGGLIVYGEVRSGMSGSPILSEDGAAIGAVSLTGGPNPRLVHNLAVGLVERILGRPIRRVRETQRPGRS